MLHTLQCSGQNTSPAVLNDLSTSPDHRFYEKWAPLTDPADTRSGIKGYVKASLNILMKGETMSLSSLPQTSSGANENIEKSVIF